jgi:hypothetical protein
MNRVSRRILLSASTTVFLASQGLTRADILLPDSKFVAHKIKFENLQKYQEDYKFFFYPLNDTVGQRGLSIQNELNKTGIVHVSGISPVAIGTTKGMYLVAVPRNMLNDKGSVALEVLKNPPAGVLKSKELVSQIRAVNKKDKDEFWTIYSVKINNGQLETGLLRHDEPLKRDKVGLNQKSRQGLFALVSSVIGIGLLRVRLNGKTDRHQQMK